jgi:hypothetical protein
MVLFKKIYWLVKNVTGAIASVWNGTIVYADFNNPKVVKLHKSLFAK